MCHQFRTISHKVFAGEEISLGEVYLYANTVIEDYEKMYGDGIWSADVSVSKDDSLNMEDVTRRDIIEDIIHVKLLNKKADARLRRKQIISTRTLQMNS